jgi:hypothetical protein
MLKKLITSIVIFAALSSTVVYALGYSYNTSIDNKGSYKYKAVRLTPEIYNKVKENMADLMLYDKDNEPMPYFINSFVESGIESRKTYDMKLVNSYLKDEYLYYDYALKNHQDGDVTATSMEVQTDEEGFAKKVEIFGGYDNVNWEKVQDDILYSVDGNKKLEITFNGVKKYTYYRFKISNNLDKVSFSSVVLKFNKTVQKKEYFLNSISPKFSAEERGNTTVVKIQGFRNLKLSGITLKTDSIFKRNVTFDGSASKVLYNLDFANTSYRDLTIPLASYRVTADTAEIVIDNKDDKPIKVSGIEAKYIADELVFEGSKSSEYTLRFGNSEIQTPKNYDIASYRELILNEGYDVLNVKEIKAEPSKTPIKPQYDYKLLFNIAISVVAVVMGIIVFLKLKK